MRNKINLSMAFAILFSLMCSQPLLAETGAIQAHDANKPLKPGEYIPDLFEKRYTQPFLVQRVTDHIYFATAAAYNYSFYVGDKEVMLIGAPQAAAVPVLGHASSIIAAVRSVTDLPITTLVYSHYHIDHIGEANSILEEAAKTGTKLQIVATRSVADQVKRYGNKVPAPTKVIKDSGGEFKFEGTRVNMHVPEFGGGHVDDNTIIYLPDEKFVQYIDIVHPEILFPFYISFGSFDFLAFEQTLYDLLDMDWEYFNGGHGNVGSKKDVQELITYLDDLAKAGVEANKTESFTDHVTHGPNDGIYTWIDSFDEAVTTKIKEMLRPKYGHLRSYDSVIQRHAVTIRDYHLLH